MSQKRGSPEHADSLVHITDPRLLQIRAINSSHGKVIISACVELDRMGMIVNHEVAGLDLMLGDLNNKATDFDTKPSGLDLMLGDLNNNATDFDTKPSGLDLMLEDLNGKVAGLDLRLGDLNSKGHWVRSRAYGSKQAERWLRLQAHRV